MKDALSVARWLRRERHFSVIPLDHPDATNQKQPSRIGKVPRIPWKAFQSTLPSDDDLVTWFNNGPRNVGLVTGAISQVVMVDGDSPAAVAWMQAHLPATEMRTQTAKGQHWGYRHPGGPAIPNKARLRVEGATLAIDVRADGGYVVAPPSKHVSGVLYARLGAWPPVSELPPFNRAWLALDDVTPPPPATATRGARPRDDRDALLARARAYVAEVPPAIEGQGGDAHTYRLACKLVRGFELDDSDALELLREWNAGCLPPWTERELEEKIHNARQYGDEPFGGRAATDAPPRPQYAPQPSSSSATHAAPPPTTNSPTLAAVEDVFARWMPDTDLIPTRVVLVTYLANRRFQGDPVWVMVVGGSGMGKTERLIPLAALPDVVLESSITGPAALLSGTGKKERAKNASGGVLRKLPKGGGLLLLKDFTSILDMHRESRAEILAALREIYDGRWDRSVGTDGGHTLTWEGRVGIIAGSTTAIDSAHAVMATMGTRFLLIRVKPTKNLALSVLNHVGHERTMRDEIRAAVCELLEHPPGAELPVSERTEGIAALGSLVALARSPVERDQQGEIRLVQDPEAPTRLVKMLANLWRAAGLLNLTREDAWALVKRVGMDSIPKLRREIVDWLATRTEPESTTAVAEIVGHPSRTTRRALEDLTAHGVVTRHPGGQGKADRWTLTNQAKTWLSGTLPVSSDTTQSTHTTECGVCDDDIPGKVRKGEETHGDRLRF